MPHMVPYYSNAAFMVGENKYHEGFAVPADAYMSDESDGNHDVERIEGKWFCRLSAPGYMDCTDWSGPFDTLEEAKAEIESMYDVDAESGEDLSDEENAA